jgi:hypothetical protein
LLPRVVQLGDEWINTELDEEQVRLWYVEVPLLFAKVLNNPDAQASESTRYTSINRTPTMHLHIDTHKRILTAGERDTRGEDMTVS